MKAGGEHRVPLPARAVSISKQLNKIRRAEFVFPGQKPGKPLSKHRGGNGASQNED
jgi:hypothetical protein